MDWRTGRVGVGYSEGLSWSSVDQSSVCEAAICSVKTIN